MRYETSIDTLVARLLATIPRHEIHPAELIGFGLELERIIAEAPEFVIVDSDERLALGCTGRVVGRARASVDCACACGKWFKAWADGPKKCPKCRRTAIHEQPEARKP